MVESTGLENRHTWEGIGGSNPPSSVDLFFQHGGLTQLVEYLAYNEAVSGSSPLTPIAYAYVVHSGYGGIGRHTRFRL